ncbi:hypothetical protein J3E69DRAFT_95117 [Trichoderma sp. SZMC 28015]
MKWNLIITSIHLTAVTSFTTLVYWLCTHSNPHVPSRQLHLQLKLQHQKPPQNTGVHNQSSLKQETTARDLSLPFSLSPFFSLVPSWAKGSNCVMHAMLRNWSRIDGIFFLSPSLGTFLSFCVSRLDRSFLL